MAIYRFEVKPISRGKGISAVGAAAYRAAQRLTNNEGRIFDYTGKNDVVHTYIDAPDDAPGWVRDRHQLWNQVERFEKRKDSRLAREVLISLPHELSHELHRALIDKFVKGNLVSLGMVADVAFHNAHDEGNRKNQHAHILITNRPLDGEQFAAKRNTFWDRTEVVEKWRANWAEILNQEMVKHGLEPLCHKKTSQIAKTNLPNDKLHMAKRGVIEFEVDPGQVQLTTETIKAVKGKNLVQLMEEMGWEVNLKKTTKRSISLRKDGRAAVVTKQDAHWVYFETGSKRKNGTAVDFLMAEQNLSFREAVVHLDKWQPQKPGWVIHEAEKRPRNFYRRYHNLETKPRSAYLEYRNLKPETYNSEAFQGKFKTMGANVLFPHYKGPRHITGIEMRGRHCRKFWVNSQRGLWHSNIDTDRYELKRLVICESPLDAMSHAQFRGWLNPETAYVATSGSISSDQLNMLKNVAKSHPWQAIHLAQDNDAAGREMANTLREALQQVTATPIHDDLPPIAGCDWNDILKKGLIATITQSPKRSRMFGQLFERDNKITHGVTEDAIFLFQYDQESLEQAIASAKQRGWQAIAVRSNSRDAEKVAQIARSQGIQVGMGIAPLLLNGDG